MLEIIRIFLVVIWFLFSSAISVVMLLLSPFNPNMVRPIARLIGLPVQKILGINTIVIDRHKFDGQHPMIVISNHQHNLDLFMVGSILPPRTVSIGKKSIKKIPFFGQVYWLTGNILIDRGNKKKAYGSMDKAARELNERSVSVWVMPEGTRSKGRGILPFKKGAFYTAISAQRPIVPVCFSSYKNLNFNQWKAGNVYIQVYDPISTVGMTQADVGPLMKRCQKIIEDGLIRLDQRNCDSIEKAATV